MDVIGENTIETFTDPDAGISVKVCSREPCNVTINECPSPGDDPAGMRNIDIFVEIIADSFKWIYIEIPFSDNDIPNGMDESSMRLFYWIGSKWSELTNTGADIQNNYVWGNLSHLTIFAPMGSIKSNIDMDSDGDGIPDDWEFKYGLNPEDSSDAKTDSDRDGYTNLEEYIESTDPLDRTSFPTTDRDKDGIPDLTDPDIDGDGVPNEDDYYPYNPDRWQKGEGKNAHILAISPEVENVGTIKPGESRTIPIEVTCQYASVTNVHIVILEDSNLEINITPQIRHIEKGETVKFYITVYAPKSDTNTTIQVESILIQAVGNQGSSDIERIDFSEETSKTPGFQFILFIGAVGISLLLKRKVESSK